MRDGQRDGLSARKVVSALVKSTLGSARAQPRSMPPRACSEMASMAWPSWLRSFGPGQSNVPESHSSRPVMVARLSRTRPVDRKPRARTTEPRTVAWCRLTVTPPGLATLGAGGDHAAQRPRC